MMVISTVMIYVRREMAGEARSSLMIGEDEFLEKGFYLDEFHEKTLLLAIAPGPVEEGDLSSFLATARELIRGEVRLVLVVAEADMARRLESRFRRLAAASLSEPPFPGGDAPPRPAVILQAPGPGPHPPSP